MAGAVVVMPTTRRTRARVLALQALCTFDAVGDGFADDLSVFLADPLTHVELGWSAPVAPAVQRVARELALETWQRREQYDELLAKNTGGWPVARMQPVERNILRLGLYELLECPDMPPAVVLNEAIELARQFGSAESSGFVNGVLDGARRQLGIGEVPEAVTPPPEEA